ncbi:MAG: adenosylmethionine decarboxylase [Candidatus Latescibacteria bacterium]|nr:adenosylmethionine decarboxylase [Candidatus Latescibacterota bacterium]
MKVAHILFDVWPREATLLERTEPLRSIMQTAVSRSGARILHTRFHQFEPHGCTGFFLLAQSHVSVHTWVEEGWMAVDILSCGDMDGMAIVDYLRHGCAPGRERLRCLERGDG